jgi:hypothetical protein
MEDVRMMDGLAPEELAEVQRLHDVMLKVKARQEYPQHHILNTVCPQHRSLLNRCRFRYNLAHLHLPPNLGHQVRP